MPERSTDWMVQAVRDLSMADHAASFGFPEWACFIAQQAAEKAIKAVYQKKGDLTWGNSIADLLKGWGFPVPEDLAKAGRSLYRWYVQARYPDGFPQEKPADYVDQEDAARAMGGAQRIVQFCEGLLAGD